MKNNEDQYFILADDNKKNEEHRQKWLFVLFAICFLVVSFTATFSFFRLQSVLEPTEPVIDIDPSSEEPISSEEPTSSKTSTIKPPVSSTRPQVSSSTATSSSSSEVSSSSSKPVVSSSSSSSSSTIPDEPIDDGSTKVLKVVYMAGTEITTENGMLPGWASGDKLVKVTNLSDVTLKYQVKWVNVTNNFNRKSDLTYHAAINNIELAQGVLPSANAILVNNVTIRPRETQIVKINVKYANLDMDQSIDMGKVFAGTILIDNVD